MKKKLMMMLVISVLLIGCGNTDTTDNAKEQKHNRHKNSRNKKKAIHTTTWKKSRQRQLVKLTDLKLLLANVEIVIQKL